MLKYKPHSFLSKNIEHIKEIGGNKKALDLGCGKGDNSIFLASIGFKVKSIDNNSDITDFFKKRIAEDPDISKKIDIEKKDFKNLEFLKNEYNFIFSFNSLIFLKRSERNEIIGKIKESLTPGGLIIISAFTVEDLSYQKFLSNNEMIEKNTFFHNSSKTYWNFFEKDELKELFNGFTIIIYEELLVHDLEPAPHNHGIVHLIAKKSA